MQEKIRMTSSELKEYLKNLPDYVMLLVELEEEVEHEPGVTNGQHSVGERTISV